jgi:hypothetical protein
LALLAKAIQGDEITEGQYAVSIGTSLAFETLFGINENVKPTNPLPYTQYDNLFVNIRTLVRNLHGAVQKELRTTWTAQHYLKKVLEEIRDIPVIISDQSHEKLSVVYYVCTFNTLQREYPLAKLREPKPTNLYENIEYYVVDQIIRLAKQGKLNIMVCDVKVPIPDERNIILTHFPVDLVPHANARNLDLLESHTGTIKNRHRWFTKLKGRTGNEGMERIPFSRKTIQIFGDGRTFAGLPPKAKQEILDFSVASRWNQTTTDRLIDAQMNRLNDKPLARMIQQF